VVCPDHDFRRGLPCAEACEMSSDALGELRAMTESCEKEGRGVQVARGIQDLSDFTASATCSGGAASLVAKGAATSWFAQPDDAELMQGSVKESTAVNEGCYDLTLKSEFRAELVVVCPDHDFRRGLPCAEACEMSSDALGELRAMTESCEKEGRGVQVARGIQDLSDFTASATCSGGAASLVAKGAATSWFAQPDDAELMQGSVKESTAVSEAFLDKTAGARRRYCCGEHRRRHLRYAPCGGAPGDNCKGGYIGVHHRRRTTCPDQWTNQDEDDHWESIHRRRRCTR